jgi:DNA polymerase-3 subunit chi
VEFYVLASAEAGARLLFACRLAEKAYHMGHRVHVQAADATAAAEIDGLLWTFRHGSFVPHELARRGATAESPVTIGHGDAVPAGAADLLINLAAEVPECLERFPRVAEVIDASEVGRRLGRLRFRAYRERGLEPATHNIGAGP